MTSSPRVVIGLGDTPVRATLADRSVGGRSELAAKLFFDHFPTLNAPAVHRVIGETYPG